MSVRSVLKVAFIGLITMVLGHGASAAEPWISFGGDQAGEAPRKGIPVVIFSGADGSRSVVPIEEGEDPYRVQQMLNLGKVGSLPVQVSLMGGFEAGSLEGLAATLGVFIGEEGNPFFGGRVRSGVLIELTPGTDATKVGVGWTVGSSNILGLNLNLTYLRTYGSSLLGSATLGSSGENLLGVELGGEVALVHWFVGVLNSLESGRFHLNAGAGVRFY